MALGSRISSSWRAVIWQVVTCHIDVKVDRLAGIAGAHVVNVHAVRRATGRRQARRHERLTGDVAADDVMGRIVELCGEEPMFVDTIDFECGDDFGERRRAVCHLGIMPERSVSRVISLGAKTRKGGPQNPVPRLV